jgi:tryptophan synthase beta chain
MAGAHDNRLEPPRSGVYDTDASWIARGGENMIAQRQVMGEELRPGYFGPYGGQFVPETLMAALGEVESAFSAATADASFTARLTELARDVVGRPTPLLHARTLTRRWGGAQVYLKREDLAHTGAHKINNAVGQGLLAQQMGKPRVIAETGAGQHGVAAAAVCALLGLQCVVYMGATDVRRQALNVLRMQLLGAEVRSVQGGTATLKDALNEALRDWVTSVRTTYFMIGTAAGPHPFPLLVRHFQSVIGTETRAQMLAQAGRLPDALVACVGGGSNAIGLFHPFLDDPGVRLIGVEAAGAGLDTGQHCATLTAGRPGILHGARSYLLQTPEGQICPTHSIAAGLDYPGVGPEHSLLKDSGRATYVAVRDAEALEGLRVLSATEGIIPALESAHAVAYAARVAGELSPRQTIVVSISGRGDKDMETISQALAAAPALPGTGGSA